MADQSEGPTCCCISHQFLTTASRNPNEIAIIHASGGAQISKEWHQNLSENLNFIDNEDDFFNSRRVSPCHPAFQGDEYFTYADLLASVNFLSRRIRLVLDGGHDPRSIKPEGYIRDIQNSETTTATPKVLGVYMKPSAEYIVTVLSILRCGEAFLPLDPALPKKRILSIISSSKVRLIVSRHSNSSDGDESDWLKDESGCAVLGMRLKENHEEHVEGLDLVWGCQSKRERKFCYLMYTSGSTGKPKGVCGTERGLLNRFSWMQELFPVHKGEILLFKTSISFIDHLQEFLSAILTCIPLVIPPFPELRANLFYIVDFMKAYSISRLIIVPSVMRAILPALQTRYKIGVQCSLQVLVFSGEVLPIFLWDMLHKLFPETTILNLYGSTEVSGDCTYFDCKRLPLILETEVLSSVPIGMPIANCDVVLVEEPNESSEGEIFVTGLCTSVGYFLEPTITSLDYVKLSDFFGHSTVPRSLAAEFDVHFRTGDFARRLHTGDLVFIGRKDRVLKMNGHRVSLEEVENILREHPDVVDAVVISSKDQGEPTCLGAHLVLKRMEDFNEMLESSIRNWLVERLPLTMIPSCYSCIKSLPLSSTGKVDYALLLESASSTKQLEKISDVTDPDLLQQIKEAFGDVLKVEKVMDNDDFFVMGGDSLAAAHVSHKLRINMRMLYIFPSPSKLLNAMLDDGLYKYKFITGPDWEIKQKSQRGNKSLRRSLRILPSMNDDSPVSSKYLKVASDLYTISKSTRESDEDPWISIFNLQAACSMSRCNKVVYEGEYKVHDVSRACWSVRTPRNRNGSMSELWKVHLSSCVDASPLAVLKDGKVFIFIGSHSHIFLCVDGTSGGLCWKVKLEGRIECSATILDDFSQVIIGCYKGNIYFLDFMTGKISWTFHTGGEVKSQPVIDKNRNLVWCGSYDHHLYALDYKKHCCVYSLSCGGSIYGSPSINMERDMLYVASTKGRVTALSLEVSPVSTVWVYELGVPVFGSLITSVDGNVVCCMVNGHVVVLSSSGSIVWKAITGGPIFAGACMSQALPSQVIICSRNGSIYSFDLEEGNLLWEYDICNPITSSAYVDENIELISDSSGPSDRLVCVCGSSGIIYLLRINLHAMIETNQPTKEALGPVVQEFAKMELPGDIFSSPVMIGGRIFVGCRDDYMHCIGVEAKIPLR